MGGRASRRSAVGGLLTLLLLGCVVALAWLGLRPDSGTDRHSVGEVPAAESGEATPTAPPEPGAVIEGRVLLELPPPEPVQRAVVVVGETDGIQTRELPPDESEGAPVQTRTAEAGMCAIRAWQDGTPRSEIVSCDAAGDYALPLHSGVGGTVAIEISVPGHLRAVLEVDVPEDGRGRLPTVALGFAETLRGQVVDARGEPLVGMVVEAMPSPNLGEPEPWRATTDDNGDYAFDTLPPGPVALRCAPEGYAPTVVEAIAPEDDVVIRIGALFTLRGKVMRGGAKAESIQLRLEGSGVWPAKVVAAKPDGTFAFAAIPDGVYAIEAVAPAATPGDPEYASIPLENVTPELEVTLALVEAYRVEVTVVNGAGEPVVGARTHLASAQIGMLAKAAKTDDAGQARLGPVVVGPYVLHADADGYLPADATPVLVEDGADLALTVVLSEAAQIRGVVVDDAGHPVEGATVAVQTDALFSVGEGQARAQMFAGELIAAGTLGVTKGPVPEIPLGGVPTQAGPADARTDAQGRFTLGGLTPGRYRLTALHGAFAASDEVVVAVRSGETKSEVRLVMREGLPLTGRVRDSNARPIASARIEFADGSRYRTDARGEFSAGRRRGRVRMVVRADGFAPLAHVVAMGGKPRDVELVMTDADAVLGGRVTNDNGRPIDNAQITVASADRLMPSRIAWTNDRGLWSIDGLGPGSMTVDFAADGLVGQTSTVRLGAADDKTVDAVLSPGWGAELVVLRRGDRNPIEGASVRGGGAHGVTDDHGLTVLDGLADPSVEVTISAADYPAKTIRVRRPQSGRAESVVELVEGGALEGIVTDYRGDPVAGASVVLRDAEGNELDRTRTRARGQYRFDGVPAGDVEVEAAPPAARSEELAEVAQASDVLRGHVTRDVVVRFDRR